MFARLLALALALVAAVSQAQGEFRCVRLLGSLTNAPFRLGESIVGRGARGIIREITGENIPPNSVVKIFDPAYEPRFPVERVERIALAYQTVHELFPENSVRPHSVIEVSPDLFGIVMERIPDRIRVYNPARVNERTIRDLERVRDALLSRSLYIVDFSFTVREDGSIVLYDLDYLYSWDRGSPFYNPRENEAQARERFNKTIDFWIRGAREDIQAQRERR